MMCVDEPEVERVHFCNDNWRIEEMSHGLVRVYRRDAYMDSLESVTQAKEYIQAHYI